MHVSNTFPPYARGGVAVGRDYQGVKFPDFHDLLPPVELYHDYNYQVVDQPRADRSPVCRGQLELMGLDSWLSIVSRTSEISNGYAALLRTTPALVNYLLTGFADDFENLDRSADDGGFQEIQLVAANFVDALEDEGLSRPEQLFAIVALLRTVKVRKCILFGPRMDLVGDILCNDAQVYFA